MTAAADTNIEARVGTSLAGKYRLERVLGAGGMGAVYAAENTWTGRKVAIKVMLSDHARDADLVARFLREARAATRVEHPHVVQILDVGQADDGAFFIVQAFLQGTDLRHVLDERGSMQPREAVDIIVPVLSALTAAHRHGVVHRDLKSENVFLARSPAGAVIPTLIDFGIAKLAEDASPSAGVTRTGMAMGTPHYMSPEQARGEKQIDAQTDVWAIGVLLYEMLAGRTPWSGETYNALLFEIVSSNIARLDQMAPSVPRQLAEIVHRALERDRPRRFRSAEDFLDALLRCTDVGDAQWRQSLRAAHENTRGAPVPLTDSSADDLDIATTVPSGAGARAPTDSAAPMGGVPARTTFGQTAREIARPGRSASRTGLALTLGLVGIVSAATAVRLATRRSDARRVPPVAPVASASGPAPTPAPARSDDAYTATITAHPSTATIALDGVDTGVSSLVRVFHRDGTRHALRVNAVGYTPFAAEFTDAPPPPVIELVAASSTANSNTHARQPPSRPARSVPSTARPTTTATTSSAIATPTAASRPAVNGAPLIGE